MLKRRLDLRPESFANYVLRLRAEQQRSRGQLPAAQARRELPVEEDLAVAPALKWEDLERPPLQKMECQGLEDELERALVLEVGLELLRRLNHRE